ncbi:hypothetical protein EVAR_44090_1 [Eumeta japonica]|uniref:Uncharacterized protein n=1 Tax=Eumeta variegata TaxID=151549 RepID=A0A4C1X282_EUMVA|nr:hypothetical protein EVAR_44090_1 [Eumeta japonica]
MLQRSRAANSRRLCSDNTRDLGPPAVTFRTRYFSVRRRNPLLTTGFRYGSTVQIISIICVKNFAILTTPLDLRLSQEIFKYGPLKWGHHHWTVGVVSPTRRRLGMRQVLRPVPAPANKHSDLRFDDWRKTVNMCVQLSPQAPDKLAGVARMATFYGRAGLRAPRCTPPTGIGIRVYREGLDLLADY